MMNNLNNKVCILHTNSFFVFFSFLNHFISNENNLTTPSLYLLINSKLNKVQLTALTRTLITQLVLYVHKSSFITCQINIYEHTTVSFPLPLLIFVAICFSHATALFLRSFLSFPDVITFCFYRRNFETAVCYLFLLSSSTHVTVVLLRCFHFDCDIVDAAMLLQFFHFSCKRTSQVN